VKARNAACHVREPVSPVPWRTLAKVEYEAESFGAEHETPVQVSIGPSHWIRTILEDVGVIPDMSGASAVAGGQNNG
jgi:hypothetical protein